jgi:hypothetical protein
MLVCPWGEFRAAHDLQSAGGTTSVISGFRLVWFDGGCETELPLYLGRPGLSL